MSKGIKEQNLPSDTTKLLKENIGETLQDIDIGKLFGKDPLSTTN